MQELDSAGSVVQNALIIMKAFYQTIIFKKFCHSLFLLTWSFCWLFLYTMVMSLKELNL